MKSVLISIQPKWVEKISGGGKTIEVRKTIPKLETPFKCYIYETKGKTEMPWVDEDGHYIFKGRGQVIGEFVCDKIDKIGWFGNYKILEDRYLEESCLTLKELYKYTKGEIYYEWHISNLKIYDKPKGLGEFKHDTIIHTRFNGYKEPITRPPQSWCYVESLGE